MKNNHPEIKVVTDKNTDIYSIHDPNFWTTVKGKNLYTSKKPQLGSHLSEIYIQFENIKTYHYPIEIRGSNISKIEIIESAPLKYKIGFFNCDQELIMTLINSDPQYKRERAGNTLIRHHKIENLDQEEKNDHFITRYTWSHKLNLAWDDQDYWKFCILDHKTFCIYITTERTKYHVHKPLNFEPVATIPLEELERVLEDLNTRDENRLSPTIKLKQINSDHEPFTIPKIFSQNSENNLYVKDMKRILNEVISLLKIGETL